MRADKDELVRINDKGEAHPIGVSASRRMRAKEGTYRVLPSPQHVVFMRYTGEDGRRDADDGAVVRVAGEVTEPGAMCDILAMLGQAGWRGRLVVLGPSRPEANKAPGRLPVDAVGERLIVFEHGNIVSADSDVPAESLPEVLYRYGAIDAEQLERLHEAVGAGVSPVAAAVQLGLSQERVFSFIGRQVEGIVVSTMMMDDGTYFFLDGFDESTLPSRHAISASGLLMDSVTMMDEMRYFRARVPTAEHVPLPLPGEHRPLPEELRPTFEAIDGHRSVHEVGRLTGRGEFATTKDVYALVQSKHVSVRPPRLEGGAHGIVGIANEALVLLHAAADEAGVGEVLRRSLAQLVDGTGELMVLLRGAGPDASGKLDASVVVQNAPAIAEDDVREALREALHEYVSFAMFSAENATPALQATLPQAVAALLADLRPQR